MSNYSRRKKDSLKKATSFKISNKHVLCQFNITHLHIFIVRSHQRQKLKVFETIEVG